jgi:isoleucyl-tRNA synthetase
VHLQRFPEPREPDSEALADGDRLLALRAIVSQALEKARADKLITNNLGASVTLRTPDTAWLARWQDRLGELEEFFILSALTLQPGETESAVVSPVAAAKCGRCWRHRDSVGLLPAHPDLCDRCAEAVAATA